EAAVLLALQATESFRASEGAAPGEGSLLVQYLLAERARLDKRYDEAIAQFNKVLAFSRRHLDSKHPLIGLQVGNLAGVYRQKGDLVMAERMIREGIDIARPTALRSLRMVVDAIKQLADYVAKRDRKEAEALYREALRYARERPEENADNIRKIEAKLEELG